MRAKIGRVAVMLGLAAMLLGACGGAAASTTPSSAGSSVGQAQVFIRQHTECARSEADYEYPDWLPAPGSGGGGASIIYDLRLPPPASEPDNYQQIKYADIHMMDANGSSDHVLIPDGLEPLLSPDKSMVLYRAWDPSPRAWNTAIFDLRNMESRSLIEDYFAGPWSSDSQWVAYLDIAKNGPFRKINVATGKSVQMTDTAEDGPVFDGAGLWSPDGKTFAFVSNRSGNHTQTYLMPSDGSGTVTALPRAPALCPTGDTGPDGPEVWLPDSSGVAIGQTCGSTHTLRVYSLAGVELDNWDWLPGGQDVQVSPDGQFLLSADTTTIDAYYAQSPTTVYVSRIDGSETHVLAVDAWGARWSPDGNKRVVYAGRDQGGYHELFVVDADGSHRVQLTQNPATQRICLH